MTGGLRVSGGSGGIGANVADMRRTAGSLDRLGDAVDRQAARVRGAAISGAIARTIVFSPGSAVRAEASLVQAAAAATGLQLGIFSQVVVLRARADLFEIADAAGSAVEQQVRAIGAIVAVEGVLAIGVVSFVAALDDELTAVVTGVLTGDVPLSELGERLKAVPGAALEDTGETLQRVLSQFPQITDVVTGGLPTVLHTASGGRLPDDLEGVIALLQGIAGRGGLLRDRAVDVRRRGASQDTPLDLSDLIGDIGGITRGSQDAHDSSAVRVVRLDGPPPRWIVEVPGTQEWDPRAGRDPSDMTSNVQLMQRRGALLEAIRDAMRDAGVAPGQQVMVAGHSQGGIAAAALAADPATRREFNISHVVTAGSPIARIPIPDDVHVLSIEHAQDPVPRLDGDGNPDRPRWTTVTRDVGDSPGVAARPSESHRADLYSATAEMIEHDPGVRPDYDAFSGFFTGPATAIDYELSRGS